MTASLGLGVQVSLSDSRPALPPHRRVALVHAGRLQRASCSPRRPPQSAERRARDAHAVALRPGPTHRAGLDGHVIWPRPPAIGLWAY